VVFLPARHSSKNIRLLQGRNTRGFDEWGLPDLISFYIFYQAWSRFNDPPEIKAGWMLIVALVGLSANISSAYVLFSNRKENLNLRGASFMY
jgi:hypothetical protein